MYIVFEVRIMKKQIIWLLIGLMLGSMLFASGSTPRESRPHDEPFREPTITGQVRLIKRVSDEQINKKSYYFVVNYDRLRNNVSYERRNYPIDLDWEATDILFRKDIQALLNDSGVVRNRTVYTPEQELCFNRRTQIWGECEETIGHEPILG